jgi:hypothetical protein
MSTRGLTYLSIASRFCPGTAAGPRHLHTRTYNSPVLPIRRNHRPRPTPARPEALGRIQNFGSWSPYLVKQDRTCLGLEFSVFEGDDLWDSADDDLSGQAGTGSHRPRQRRRRRGRLRGASDGVAMVAEVAHDVWT